MCRFVGTVPDILGLLWPSFRPDSGSKSNISGRILKSFQGPFGSADLGWGRDLDLLWFFVGFLECFAGLSAGFPPVSGSVFLSGVLCAKAFR